MSRVTLVVRRSPVLGFGCRTCKPNPPHGFGLWGGWLGVGGVFWCFFVVGGGLGFGGFPFAASR